jgi:hypothetical protein
MLGGSCMARNARTLFCQSFMLLLLLDYSSAIPYIYTTWGGWYKGLGDHKHARCTVTENYMSNLLPRGRLASFLQSFSEFFDPSFEIMFVFNNCSVFPLLQTVCWTF